MAQQFIAAVASTAHIFNCKPIANVVTELLEYILQKEILQTAHIGSKPGYCPCAILCAIHMWKSHSVIMGLML